MIRLFSALAVDEETAEKLAAMRVEMDGLRWIAPENYHITLVFFGSVNVYLYRQIRQQLKMLAFAPLTIEVDHIGFFSSKVDDSYKVLYAGIKKTDELMELQQEIVNHIEMLHPNLDLVQKFVPHITLARLNHANHQQVERFVETNSEIVFKPFQVNDFTLFSSQITPMGSIYTRLESYPASLNRDFKYETYQIL